MPMQAAGGDGAWSDVLGFQSNFQVPFVMRFAGCAPRLAQVLCVCRQRIWGSMGMTQSLLGDKDCWLQARLRTTRLLPAIVLLSPLSPVADGLCCWSFAVHTLRKHHLAFNVDNGTRHPAFLACTSDACILHVTLCQNMSGRVYLLLIRSPPHLV